jgi:hypothetical protein
MPLCAVPRYAALRLPDDDVSSASVSDIGQPVGYEPRKNFLRTPSTLFPTFQPFLHFNGRQSLYSYQIDCFSLVIRNITAPMSVTKRKAWIWSE